LEYNSEQYTQGLVSPFSFYVFILFDVVFTAVVCHLFFELVGCRQTRHVTSLVVASMSFL